VRVARSNILLLNIRRLRPRGCALHAVAAQVERMGVEGRATCARPDGVDIVSDAAAAARAHERPVQAVSQENYSHISDRRQKKLVTLPDALVMHPGPMNRPASKSTRSWPTARNR
jgi:aspartate carbamoyltransferase catalytic subunit